MPGLVRWRIIDLCQRVWEELRVSVSEDTISGQLWAMGYRKLSARPRHHAQAEGAIEDFKKTFLAKLAQIAEQMDVSSHIIEIWFADEARIGQKNKITRRCARRGTRPSAPQDQRTALASIIGAICPAEGKGAVLVFSPCNIEVMNLHLAEISSEVAPGCLKVTANITLMALPPKCPERNPAANVWQFIRDNSLSNRVFKPYEDTLDHCCSVCNKPIEQPWRIKSIGLRDWVHASCSGEMAVNKLYSWRQPAESRAQRTVSTAKSLFSIRRHPGGCGARQLSYSLRVLLENGARVHRNETPSA